MMNEWLTTLQREYAVLRDGGGIVQLRDWSSVTVTGADRQSFLHNFCTNDIKRLATGDCCEAFFTNVKGKIVGHGLVTCCEGELVVVGPPRQAARLIEHLDRYVLREDVQLRDTTTERAYWASSRGLQIADAVRADVAARMFPWDLFRIGTGASCLIEIVAAASTRFSAALAQSGATVCSPAVFDVLRIEAGVPLDGVDFDEHNFPQEVGRDAQAISFTKGCYLGQETVARIDAMGHVNQRIAGLRFAGEIVPAAGAGLSRGGKAVGHVTSAAYSPRLAAPLALAMVRREHAEPGSSLDSPVGACEVIALPLPD
jgi:folate-binding protein YgfZ